MMRGHPTRRPGKDSVSAGAEFSADEWSGRLGLLPPLEFGAILPDMEEDGGEIAGNRDLCLLGVTRALVHFVNLTAMIRMPSHVPAPCPGHPTPHKQESIKNRGVVTLAPYGASRLSLVNCMPKCMSTFQIDPRVKR